MERYDGKTKKDDYIKYALIAVGIIVLIIIYKLVTWGIHKVSHPTPDITIVVDCENVVDFEIENNLEETLETYIPDIDGNGKIVVDVLPLRIVENEAVTSYELDKIDAQADVTMLREYFTKGTYTLFLLSDVEDRPEFSNYLGVEPPAVTYCNKSYCRTLPEDLADGENPYRTNLTGCKLLKNIGWERVPFYGCIQKNASEEDYQQAIDILCIIKEA